MIQNQEKVKLKYYNLTDFHRYRLTVLNYKGHSWTIADKCKTFSKHNIILLNLSLLLGQKTNKCSGCITAIAFDQAHNNLIQINTVIRK